MHGITLTVLLWHRRHKPPFITPESARSRVWHFACAAFSHGYEARAAPAQRTEHRRAPRHHRPRRRARHQAQTAGGARDRGWRAAHRRLGGSRADHRELARAAAEHRAADAREVRHAERGDADEALLVPQRAAEGDAADEG